MTPGIIKAVGDASGDSTGDKSPEKKSGDMSPHSKDWPHAPIHRLTEHGIYMVTASTLYKQKVFRTNDQLDLLEGKLLTLAKQYGWQLEAWSVFANHYHFVARGSESSRPLKRFLTHLHADTARELNRMDGEVGRQVWFNFWDSQITFERSYFARLNYVHQNAVHHGLVRVANQYPWCSAAWFERSATPAQVQTIYSFKIDKLQIPDDF